MHFAKKVTSNSKRCLSQNFLFKFQFHSVGHPAFVLVYHSVSKGSYPCLFSHWDYFSFEHVFTSFVCWREAIGCYIKLKIPYNALSSNLIGRTHLLVLLSIGRAFSLVFLPLKHFRSRKKPHATPNKPIRRFQFIVSIVWDFSPVISV